jgi:predicted secreted protein
MRAIRAGGLVTAAVLCLVLLPSGAAAAEPPTISDAITAGVVRTGDGFGTSTVIVPSGGYVTSLVRAPAALAGQTVEIWTRTRTSDWAPTTSRLFDADGVARYFARISEWTGFVARYPVGGPATARSHGRAATVSADGSTTIRLSCDAFDATGAGSVLVERSIGARVGSLVTVVLCSNGSTGFSWATSAASSEQLTLVRHRVIPGPSIPGAPGAEAFTYRVVGRGTGYTVLEYSRPWEGGEKAAWLFVLRVN